MQDEERPTELKWLVLLIAMAIAVVLGVVAFAWADNMTVTQGTGTNLATDTIASVHYQRMKLITGADNSNDGDVSSANPLPVGGSGATALGKVEDSAAGAADVGAMCLAVRNDAASAQTSATGDYTAISANSFGAPYANIDSDFQKSAAKGILKSEDAGHTTGDAGVMALGVYQSTPTTMVSANQDYSTFACNGFGAQYVNVDSGWQGSQATGILKAEDSAAIDGNALVGIAAVRNEAMTTTTSAAGDFTPPITDASSRLIVTLGAVNAGGGTIQTPFFAEDTPHTSTEAGLQCLQVRTDSPTTLTSTNGDYIPTAANTFGAQHVVIDADFQNGGTTKILKTEDSGSNNGDAGVMIMGVYRASPTAVIGTDGDYSAITTNVYGGQFCALDYRYQQDVPNGLLKLEDAGHLSGDAGVPALGVYQASPTNMISADQDYINFAANIKGAQYVAIDQQYQQNTTYSLLKLEDTAHVDGAAGVATWAVRNDDDSNIQTSANNDYSPISVDSRGRVSTNLNAVNAGGGSYQLGWFREDGAHNDGDAGSQALFVRRNSATTLTSAEGDYASGVVNKYGAQRIDIQRDFQDNAIGTDKEALLKAEDSNTSSGQAVVMAGAHRNDASSTLTDTDGEVSDIAVDPAGRLKVVIEPGSGTGQVGVDLYRNLDLGTTGQVIKASAGKVHGFRLYNRATALRYVKFYDKATAPTGADTPIATLVLPAAAASSASVEAASLVVPWTHASGISVRATTGIADADTGAPSTNDVIVHVLYK